MNEARRHNPDAASCAVGPTNRMVGRGVGAVQGRNRPTCGKAWDGQHGERYYGLLDKPKEQ